MNSIKNTKHYVNQKIKFDIYYIFHQIKKKESNTSSLLQSYFTLYFFYTNIYGWS